MNARIRALDQLNSKSRQELDKYIFSKAMEIYNSEAAGLMRRCFKTLAVALNEKYGFGHDRLIKLLDCSMDIAKLRNTDEIYWKHIDDVVIKQIGLEFDRENYDDLDV